MGFNYYGMDWTGNEQIFLHAELKHIHLFLYGWAFNYLSYIFNQNNLSYVTFEVFLTGISLLILYYIICKHTKYSSLFVSLFYIYPAIDCAIQRRYFPCMVLCILAMHFMFEKKKFWRIKYLITIYLAYGFHEVAFFFFPLFIACLFKKKILIRLIILFDILLFILLEFLSGVLGTYISLIKFYLSEGWIAPWKGYFFMAEQLIFIFIVMKIQSRDKGLLQNKQINNKENLIMLTNYYSCLILPLYLYGAVFMRFFRPSLIYDYGIVTARIKKNYSVKRKTALYLIAFISYLCIYSILNYFILGANSFGSLVKPFFVYNRVFNLFMSNIPTELTLF